MASEDQRLMGRKIFLKKFIGAVDGCGIFVKLLIPPDGGELLKPSVDGVCSRTFWDCKLELNFVPARSTETWFESADKIEFFCA
jgi:hypothetical protein